jgi:hypothetical protein
VVSSVQKRTVSSAIVRAFRQAAAQNPSLHKAWISISYLVGGLLPASLLMVSIQRVGELDILLRCMEDEFAPSDENSGEEEVLAPNYQLMLSEMWVGAVYEIFRLLAEREIGTRGAAFEALAHDFRLLRIPMEKHEIAADRKITGPLIMQSRADASGTVGQYEYSSHSKLKAHIMPAGISPRGSAMWHVTDVQAKSACWLERRGLSERVVALWTAPSPTEGLGSG